MLLAESYLDYLRYERNYAEGTVRYYRATVLELQEFGKERGLELTPGKVDVELVRDWIVSMMDKGSRPGTINRKLSSLRTYFKYLLREEKVVTSPLIGLSGPKKQKLLPVFLREKDVEVLLDEVSFGDGFEGCRNHLIVEMLYSTGMRASELVGLNDEDVDFLASVIKVTGKRNKQRLIPFGKKLEAAIREYVGIRDGEISRKDNALFVRADGSRISYRIVFYVVERNLSKVVAVKKRSPHVLRHTFATAMLNNGAELSAIKELLGHESLATTEIYTHTTFEELKKVYNQAHPRAD